MEYNRGKEITLQWVTFQLKTFINLVQYLFSITT